MEGPIPFDPTPSDPAPLAEICSRHRIRRLALFGSRLHGRSRPESDLDLLVEFLPDSRVGFLEMARIEKELAALFGLRVDLRTPAELPSYFRPEVEAEARQLYAA